MPVEVFLALVALIFAAAWTPGPNNALVASSAVNFGLRRTVPHVMGITLGFPVMILLVGLFLGELFQTSAVLREAVRWGGAALLLGVAWSVARTGGIGFGIARARPFSLMEAAAFQWINPKGWAMAVAITAQFIDPAAPWASAGIVALVSVAAGLTSSLGWALAGRGLTRWLSTGRRLRLFNVVMGALIGLMVIFVVMS